MTFSYLFVYKSYIVSINYIYMNKILYIHLYKKTSFERDIIIQRPSLSDRNIMTLCIMATAHGSCSSLLPCDRLLLLLRHRQERGSNWWNAREDPVTSIGTQRNNVALGYGNPSSYAKYSHFFSLRKSCASDRLKPQVYSETPLPGWTPEVQHWDVVSVPAPPRSAVLNFSGQLVVVSHGPDCFCD